MPFWLNRENFSSYPPLGREVAITHLDALRQIPVSLLPVFLVDLKSYDWSFPIEQREIIARLELTRTLPSSCAAFSNIVVPVALDNSDRVQDPQQFLADMVAYLWSSLQMDAYRNAADRFVSFFDAMPKSTQPILPRLVMIFIGRNAGLPPYPLFQKMRSSGMTLTNVRPEGAAAALLDALDRRSARHPAPYAHWYVDGGSPLPGYPAAGVTHLFYPALAFINKQILATMMSCIDSGSGPEILHARLGRLSSEISSANGFTSDPCLQHFAVSLLTQGSGTQIFSTSFVQWTTREVIRRAQPTTILARYAPRQRQKAFNAMVADAASIADLDPDGSLVDADMGAYYAYIEQKRLPAADRDRFLVWFEDRSQAFVAGPDIATGTMDRSPIAMTELLSRMQTDL